jgi:hypothetical protein
MAMYVDDYGIVDTEYIVDATPMNPSEEHGIAEYVIGIILHVGMHSHCVAHVYPTRALRDAAFEQLCALIKQEAQRVDVEDDD